jgi:ribosomal protein S18 acetylase RimI-like enzyme
MRLRSATPEDARALVELNNFAGEGLSLFAWECMAEPGETGWECGVRRARCDVGPSSWRNTRVIEEADTVAACLLGFPLPEVFEPIDLAETPPVIVPLEELERLVPGTWYLAVVAAYPEFRGRGFGSMLIEHASGLAAKAHCTGVSLIVADTNPGARRLYERSGYVERARCAAVKQGWDGAVREWILMVRE